MGSMATQPVTLMTEEEYLRKERSAKFKSEFVGGEMFAMPGGTPKHSMLEANTVGEFRALYCTVAIALAVGMRYALPSDVGVAQ